MLCDYVNYMTNLQLNADLDEAPNNGEYIADDKQDVPAINEFHPVSPAHVTP